MHNQLQKLIKQSSDPKLIQEAFEFADRTYNGRVRSSGETYIDHAVRVALILAQMNLDQKTIIGGLLHDCADTKNIDDKKSIIENITKKFGGDIAGIVEKNSQLNKIYYVTRGGLQGEKLLLKENIEKLRKMFFAISQDLRVILIDLASRIDGMEHIINLPEKMRKSYATETLEIFVPVANRLGLGEIKAKLEDMAFAYLEPKKFTWLQGHIKEKYEQRQTYLKKFIPHLKKILHKERLNVVDVNFRAKSYWSTYQKLLTHNMDFELIHDLVAIRVIVKDVSECYKALGILHKYFQPTSKEIKDYIAKPKINGYKSLHTTVTLEEERISEIQIRTEQMQQEAQLGVCAHWSYKEKIDLRKEGEAFNWTDLDFFAGQIFAFTPKGDVIVLPKGATAVDFAYALHSDIGNHCESAKIDGKIITLSQTLENGDVVEIITNKNRKPSYDWLKFVKTGFARSHIKKLISIPLSIFSVPSFVRKKIVEYSEAGKKRREEKENLPTGRQVKKAGPAQIYLAGQKGMMTTVAKCCLPKSTDPVKAYLTRHRAAVLHKTSCLNLQKLSQKFPEKIVEASWK